MEHQILTLTLLRSATVLLGGVFLLYTWRAYLKHRSHRLLLLFTAVLVLTLAAIVEGFSVQVLRMNLNEAHVIESVITLAGFGILVASVWSRRRGKATFDAEAGLDESQTPPT